MPRRPIRSRELKRRLGPAAILACLLAFLPPARAMEFDARRFIDVDELKVGDLGTSTTVFEGIEPESFEVRILGVMKNATPRGDLVLVRLLGPRLEQIGVAAGMSGSPVYIGDRLLGAIAFAIPYAKEPIGLVTPIRSMIQTTWHQPDPGVGAVPAAQPTLAEVLALARGEASATQPAGPQGIVPLSTPLMLSGADPSFLERVGPLLGRYGFVPVQGGASGTAPEGSMAPRPVELGPGSSLAIPLVRGDFEYSAVGTVTYREGDELLAFGHPFQLAGSVELPAAPAYVHATVANLRNSFKIASAGPVVGTLVQDRQNGLHVRLGPLPPALPVEVVLRGLEGAERKYSFELAQNQYLTPMLLLLAVSQTVAAEGRSVGPTSFDVRVEAELEGHGTLRFSDLVGGADAFEAMTTGLQPLIEVGLSPFEAVRFRSVRVELDAVEQRRDATVRRVRLPQRVVRAGDVLEVQVDLDAYGLSEPAVVRLPLTVPAGMPEGTLRVYVLDQAAFEALEGVRKPGAAPQSLAELLRLQGRRLAHNELRLVVLDPRPGVTVAGREMAALPPTVQSLLEQDLGTGAVHPTAGSIVFQSSVKTPFVISGAEVAELWVRP